MNKEFINRFGETEAELHTYFCPGRVNLIGEHIDYNGGLVLPAAISLGTYLYIRKRDDGIIRMQSVEFMGEYTLSLNEEPIFNPEKQWANYPFGCIALLKENGVEVGGYDMLFSSDLPIGAGLSSSASIEVLTLFALLAEEGNTQFSKEEIALLAQQVENNFVGMNCGIMDQFAVAMGKANHAIKLNCQTLEYEYIPIDFGEYSLVIMNTNKPRSLIHSAYNQRLAECRQALAIINQNHAYANLCEVPLNIATVELTDNTLFKRAAHCITEQARVITACKALTFNNIDLVAASFTASHNSLKAQYEVTGYELDTIFNEAKQFDGCIGARMTGAGFGGCAIALVITTELEGFKVHVGKRYLEATGLEASFYPCKIADGVRAL